MLKALGLSLLLILATGCFRPAWSYQAWISQQNVPVKSSPDLRGRPLTRLSRTLIPIRHTFYAADGELWCQVKLPNQQTGWVEARYLDPVLEKNLPLHLQDIPASLFFSFAQRQLGYANLKDSSFRQILQRQLLLMEVAQLKQRWDALRSRHDFLDISRRIGIKINAHEFQQLAEEQRHLEQQFQRLLSLLL